VAASDQGGLTVYLGDGSGTSWQEVSSDGLPSSEDPGPAAEELGGWANQVLLHDMNGDGHLDVVASYYLGPRVWLGSGEAQWTPYSEGLPSPIIGGLFRGIAAADVNHDGRTDLAVANSVNGPEVFLQSESGTWQTTPDVFPNMKGGAVAVALGDLDQDGHPDLVTGGRLETRGSGFGLTVHRGDGTGGWHEFPHSDLPSRGLPFTWGITLRDVNGDRLPDMAVGTGGATDGTVSGPEERLAVLPTMQVWLNDADRAIAER